MAALESMGARSGEREPVIERDLNTLVVGCQS
jgi:hypothetical protein